MGVNRILGWIIAIAACAVGVVFLNILPFLEYSEDIKNLREKAFDFEKTYGIYQQNLASLFGYSKTLQPNETQMQEVSDYFASRGYEFVAANGAYNFSGKVDTETFSSLINRLGERNLIEVTVLNSKSEKDLPILVGEGLETKVDIKKLELKIIDFNKALLKR